MPSLQDKNEYLEFWGYTLGTPEAEQAWKEKLEMTYKQGPMLNTYWEDYQSPIDGRPIVTKKARKEDMARNNCMEYENGMKQDNDRRLHEGERDLERKIDAHVEREWASMSSRERENLAKELLTHNIEYTRR